jgi:sec-independent protein translocase protein TatC
MGFFDHIGELRKTILWSAFFIGLACIVSGVFITELIEKLLLGPALDAGLELQNLRTMGQPFLYFKIILYAGFVIAFPFVVWQIWKFVEPALYKNEKNWARGITFFTTICFLTGLVFAYSVMIPSMLAFSAGFGTEKIKNIIDVNNYFSFITLQLIASGLFFELPMVSFVLSRAGLLTPEFMRKYRRHAIVVILLVAAIITPSPDPFNQMIVATPIYVLYELSIIISKIALNKYLKNKNENL